MAARKSAKRGTSPKAKSKQTSKAKPAAKRRAPARSKKVVAKKAAPKKPVAKKAIAKKVVAKKAIAKKAVAKKPVAKKPVAKKAAWPSVTLPALPEIEGYVRSLPPPIVPIVNRLRQLVRDAAPEARELMDPNGPVYDSNGLFARIEAGDRQVLITFLKGAQLDAAEGTLLGKGDTRALSVDSLEGLRESVLQGLVRQAVMLNGRDPSSGAV
ncbi:MAG: DUF1801 domain-containing protein [Myxococcales bacterium]|nr:DUF1801 domain-containing protein [Myxococcales bacterium]